MPNSGLFTFPEYFLLVDYRRQTAGEAAKARAAQQGGQGPAGAAGAERRRRKGEEAEWESGVADARGLEGEGGAK